MELPIVKDWWGAKKNLFHKNSIALDPGMTILVGCNGSGKTTLICQIKNYCKEQRIPYIDFDGTSQDSDTQMMDHAAFHGDYGTLAEYMSESEGERIGTSIAHFCKKVGNYIYHKMPKNFENPDKIFITMDAADSGFSIDNIVELTDEKHGLFNLVMEDCKSLGLECYILIAANSFEFARNRKCLDVTTLKYIEFGDDYNKYRNFVLKTRQKKNKRYGCEEGEL